MVELFDSIADKLLAKGGDSKGVQTKTYELTGREPESEIVAIQRQAISALQAELASLQSKLFRLEQQQTLVTPIDITHEMSLDYKRQKEAKEKGYVSYFDVAEAVRRGLVEVYFKEGVYCGRALDLAHFVDVTTGNAALVLTVLDEEKQRKDYYARDLFDMFDNPRYLAMHLKRGRLTLNYSFKEGKLKPVPELQADDGVSYESAEVLVNRERKKRQEAEQKVREKDALLASTKEKLDEKTADCMVLLKTKEELKAELDSHRQKVADANEYALQISKEQAALETGREMSKAALDVSEGVNERLWNQQTEILSGTIMTHGLNLIKEAKKATERDIETERQPQQQGQQEQPQG